MSLSKRLEELVRENKLLEENTERILHRRCELWLGQEDSGQMLISFLPKIMEVNPMHKHRTKSEIRIWLRTPEGRAWLNRKIEARNESKEVERRRRAVSKMKRLGLHYDCAKCIHGIGKHCTWRLPDGCTDFVVAE